jgi:hypothetical protein
MNEAPEELQHHLLAPLKESGPGEFLITFLLVAIGIYHITLSLRTLAGRGGTSAASVHALLLFSTPCLLFLLICGMLPTTFPKLFIVGIDEGNGLRHALELTSFLGWLCLWSFIPNLFLSLAVLTRSQKS